jgi:cellulose synthase/poly-beta-1,6-N-acetylglucosamine synthase-like glycosyltransferase
MLLPAFLTASLVLWTSVFGYVAVLLLIAARRGASRSAAAPPDGEAGLPQIAVVVPVRNEERYIAAKLSNLRRTDYPAERLSLIVADGGSTDATLAIVESERECGFGMKVLRVPDARGKADQINAALASLDRDLVVFTDGDADLDPGCIRALVETLRDDPQADVVGARIVPATRLLEERIHWWILNSLWWLEGEALGNGQVSGVCFAVRRSALSLLPRDCTAEDIRFGLLASARGRRVRLSRRAVATELRVPQTPGEFASFRNRRGSGYVRELRRIRPVGAPLRWHFMQALRLFHFFVMPLLALAIAGLGTLLLFTPDRHWPLLLFAVFALPAAIALLASKTLGEGRRLWLLGMAAGRLTGLVWLTLLALLASPRATTSRFAKGD